MMFRTAPRRKLSAFDLEKIEERRKRQHYWYLEKLIKPIPTPPWLRAAAAMVDPFEPSKISNSVSNSEEEGWQLAESIPEPVSSTGLIKASLSSNHPGASEKLINPVAIITTTTIVPGLSSTPEYLNHLREDEKKRMENSEDLVLGVPSNIQFLDYDYSILDENDFKTEEDVDNFAKAKACFKNEDLIKAIQFFHKVNHPFAKYNVGICYLIQAHLLSEYAEGFTKLAIEEFKNANDIAEAHYNLGVYYLKKSNTPCDDYSIPIAHFEKAANLSHHKAKKALTFLKAFIPSSSVKDTSLDEKQLEDTTHLMEYGTKSKDEYAIEKNMELKKVWEGWERKNPFIYSSQMALKKSLKIKGLPSEPLIHVLFDFAYFRRKGPNRYHWGLFFWQPNKPMKIKAAIEIITFFAGDKEGKNKNNSALLTPEVLKSANDGELKKILIKYDVLEKLNYEGNLQKSLTSRK